jgi:hypothetical protein
VACAKCKKNIVEVVTCFPFRFVSFLKFFRFFRFVPFRFVFQPLLNWIKLLILHFFFREHRFDLGSFLFRTLYPKSPELISCKKWPPGPEAAVPRAIQGNRSYHHGLADKFNVSNGSISNIMKLFIALGGELHRFATKKLQIATPN